MAHSRSCMANQLAQNRSIKAIIALTVLSIVLQWLLSYSSSLRALEGQMLDQLIKYRASKQTASQEIVVIDIDDTSIIAMSELVGKWPWPRSVHAELLEYILSHQPRAVVFDILFSEPDVFRPDADLYLSEVIKDNHNVYLAMASQASAGLNTPLLATYPKASGLEKTSLAKPDARAYLLLPHAISNKAWRLGSIDFMLDEDGIGRRYALYHDYQGWRMPSLPAKLANDLGYKLPQASELILDWQSDHFIPHERHSYAEILSQARGEKTVIPDSFFRDRIVVVGTTALGLHDFRATPITELYPGLFILTTAIDNLISGDNLRTFDKFSMKLIASVMFIILAIFAVWRGLWLGITLASICLVGVVLASVSAAVSGTLVYVFTNCIALLVFILGTFFVLYFDHQRALAETLTIFNRFMDPSIVKKLLSEDSSEDMLSSKSVEVTMLFSDIRNFTSISEQRTPGEMVNLLNHYFDRQVTTLFKYHATLDKFIGDAVMAFWGAPMAHEEHPVFAINAALEMIENLEIFKAEYGYKDFDIGIGIHTGFAVVGMVGAQQRYDYTVIGDTVNLASRIEGLTKNCAQILVSETTMEVAKGYFDFIPRGEFQVKGRNQTVKVYEPKRKIS